MSAALAVAGALLIVVAVLDALVTTLAAGRGGGPVTRRLGDLVYRTVAAFHRGGRSTVLPYAGALVLIVTICTWAALLWGGWAMVFSASDRAVVGSLDGDPASTAARIYYAGFVVFTLGVGDYVPGAGVWQVLTAFATFIGLAVVTLSITYLVSVVSAAVSRRALARQISLSGLTGADVVRLHWAGDGMSSQFSSVVSTLVSQVLQTTQQHLAYPVLHHFRAESRASSAPCALAVLDDALVLASEGLPPSARPAQDVRARLERALEHYSSTVASDGADEHEEPPLPSLAALREAGIPTVEDAAFAAALERHSSRRRRLHSLVRADSWDWPTEP